MTLDQAQAVQKMAVELVKLSMTTDSPESRRTPDQVMSIFMKLHENLINQYPERYRIIK